MGCLFEFVLKTKGDFMIYCTKCGTENNSNAKFCKNCGFKFENITENTGSNYRNSNASSSNMEVNYENFGSQSADYNVGEGMTYETTYEGRKSKKSNGIKILIIVLSVILAVLIGVAAWIIVSSDSNYNGNNEDENDEVEQSSENASGDNDSANNGGEDNSHQESNEGGDDKKEQKKFDRNSTFSPSLYYGIDAIYNSTEASDEECFEMEDFITEYNEYWVDYVNTGNTAIYECVREGTAAYLDVEKYRDTDITERMHFMNVEDIRKTDDFYFVWCHEKLEKTSPSEGTEVKVHHWIYKVGKDSEGYYVETYISDPYYK